MELTNIVRKYINNLFKVRVYRITIKFYKDPYDQWFFRGIKELYVISKEGEHEDVKEKIGNGNLK